MVPARQTQLWRLALPMWLAPPCGHVSPLDCIDGEVVCCNLRGFARFAIDYSVRRGTLIALAIMAGMFCFTRNNEMQRPTGCNLSRY